VSRLVRLERRLHVPLDLQARGVSIELTPEQRAAVEERGTGLFIHANAGSGKTRVLVERFVRAVVDDGVPVDRILAITFTEKAAGELRARLRQRFLELGERDRAREAEAAWVSTIHGFCSKLLRRHALLAGIDPEYEVLDETRAARIAIDAFDRALEGFLDPDEPERLDLAAAHTPDRLRRMVTTVHAKRRSAGEERPELPERREPRLGDERAVLATAVGDALVELGAQAGASGVDRAIAKLERCRDALDEVADGDVGDPAIFADFVVKTGRTKALQGAAMGRAGEALEAWVAVCAARRAHGDYVLLRELLRGYTAHYAEAKERESAVDFDDLELLTCRLLEEHPALHKRYGAQFEHILVDEFQDTNQLQIRLLDLLAGEDGRLFTVGDEFQSIYGFRHADVGVFRAVRDKAAAKDRVRALRTNFRSRPEILRALNDAFAPHWHEGFEPLEPAEGTGPAADQLQLDLNGSTPVDGGPAVELIVVDQVSARWDDAGDEPFGPGLAGLAPWRAAEMRLLADRIRRLIDEGRAPDEIVVLLRAGVDMPYYERALRERGIETYVVGGRNYWTQQQVADLRAYMAVLANPLDEEALYSVFGSPLGGLSLDAIGLLGLGARRLKRDPWWALTAADGSDGLVDSLPASDRERVPGLVTQIEQHRVLAATVPLERMLDRVITDSGYDRALLALPDGRRRMANVRKLMRLARAFEAEQGGDLRAFIDYLAEQDVLAAREGEAPLEAEDLHAVRLMTIHAAKGLEFPVVCVADLGRFGRGDDDALRVTDDGRVGLKIASMAGGSAKGLDLEAIQKEQEAQQDEEERRIFYVAMTRAQDLLVLSGATDTEQWPDPRPLGVPMNWIWRGFAPGLDAGAPHGARSTVCSAENIDDLLDSTARYGGALVGEDSSVPVAPLKEFERFEAAPALPVGRLSYSGLARYRACGYRFYLERVIGLRELEPLPGDESQPEPPGSDELSPLLRGTVVHELLERLDFGDPAPPTADDVAERLGSYGADTGAAAVEDTRRFVAAFLGTPLFERLAAAERVRQELAFAYELAPPEAGGRSLLVNGFVDVYAEEPDRVLIVDYKTDSLEGTDPESLCDAQYSIQRLIYALAALRSGAAVVEVAYCFLEQPDAPATREWTAADAAALEQELLGLAAGVIEGRFEPAAEPHLHLCAQCAGRPSLCSWDQAATTRVLDATLET
jgi:ATP-dependent exoDNAse (exonuclease V) beta subunit